MTSRDKLTIQACEVARECLRVAIIDINELFNDVDFANKNPALVLAYLRISSGEFANLSGLQKLDHALGRFPDTLNE